MIVQLAGNPKAYSDVFELANPSEINPFYCFVSPSENSATEGYNIPVPVALADGNREAIEFRDWWLQRSTDAEKEWVGYNEGAKNFWGGRSNLIAADARR